MKIKNEDQFLRDLKKLLQIKTVSGDAGAVTSAAPLGENILTALDYMLALGQKEGFQTKNCDGYCGYIEMGQGQEMIAILTHLDTVSVGDGWSVPPFDLTILDDKAYGRGILDDKGPAMVSLYAMKALKDRNLNRRIRLILGGDEESGEWQCMERYKQSEESPLYSFSPDSGFPAIFAEKGIMNVVFSRKVDERDGLFTLSGGNQINAVPDYAKACSEDRCYEIKGKAAHASEPQKGVNAIIKLAQVLTGQGISNPMVKLLNMVNKDGLNIDLSDEVSKLTIVPSIVKVDENEMILKCDIRYPVTMDSGIVLDRIKTAVNSPEWQIEMTHDVKPLYVDKNGFLIKTLQGVYQDLSGDLSEPVVSGGGTYARAFKNAVAFGGIFPDEENTCHQKDEFWTLDSMRKNYEIIIEALSKLAE
ncbi:MAG: succinyl-diaminopimelate desuccinylase [Eubacteriaceae bacterium]|jgi:succinyl-diaminopimelate desuccinylase|nr:succinyl-diaminopimelate desuccinylase [Eubacteriaceae bacterium]MDK2905127.1 succinyl-diaminopimelate desuccinylase [Eubacteriaceae bacterium]